MNKWQIQDKLFNVYAFYYLCDMWINSKLSAKNQVLSDAFQAYLATN